MGSSGKKDRSSGEIKMLKVGNARSPYEHQTQAMERLDALEASASSYSTLVVLPTGGGKPFTASTWLLRTGLNRGRKVLWLAHRHILLEQALESFKAYSYAEVAPRISSFRYRIVSGAKGHSRVSDISPRDDLLILSKDSIARNPAQLDKWLDGQTELYFVVDEAHHSTTTSYRRVIHYIQSKVPDVKLIGLTATPFRREITNTKALSRIYPDDIVYQISLKELINRRILSTPYFEVCSTLQDYGISLGLEALQSIQRSDQLPIEIAKQMAENAARNQLIVDTYLNNSAMYGQTIVFAINVVHAIQLSAMFNDAGIKADYIVSSIFDTDTGTVKDQKENAQKLERYRQGELQILISVNILTEGADLPMTKSVFLTRPTVSAIVMTQMVGRALRGEKAGGTADAHIVSFVDIWGERIAWVNPESLLDGDNDIDIGEDSESAARRDIRALSLAKIEEFAKMLDAAIDTTELEKVPFSERIPAGMYFIHLEEPGENSTDYDYQVMVYDVMQDIYAELMRDLPELFREYDADDEYLSDELLAEMEQRCALTYFTAGAFPPYDRRDVINILKYYAQYRTAPPFHSFADVDRNKLDVQQVAQYIWDGRLDERSKADYINRLWNDRNDDVIRLFFQRKNYFIDQINREIVRIAYPDIYGDSEKPKSPRQTSEDLPLADLRQTSPATERALRDAVFSRHQNEDGEYYCAKCGVVSPAKIRFHVAYITPLSEGGKTVAENMQILCRHCYEENQN